MTFQVEDPVRVAEFDSLARVLPGRRIITQPSELVAYEIDAGLDRGQPDAVVLPLDAEDVVALVKWAEERRVPLVARGAGTGISGGAVAEQGGIIVEFSRMNRILEFDETERRAVVQPGVINQTLDELARAKGLYYPPDPASGRACTVGGNIAENAGGPHCFKYGVTTNYVTGLEVVLADARRVRLGGRALDYPEYDLTGVLTGNEGTLGLITEATVRLIRNPRAVKTMMAAFDSVEGAGEAVSAIIARGLVPATIEMMDQKMMQIVEDYAHPGLPVEAAAALIIEVDGWSESLAPQINEIITTLRGYYPIDLRVAETAAERDQIWHARKSVAGAITRLTPAYYSLDVTVPRSKLAPILKAIDQICDAAGLRVGYVLHAGDGNLHPDLFIENPSDPLLMPRVLDAARQIIAACVSQDGSITGEHGVGIEKRDFMPLMHTADELSAMQDLKAVFDPQNLLNPGKIFPRTGESGKWKVERGKWKVESGEWKVDGGKWKVESSLHSETYIPPSLVEAVAVLRDCFTANPSRSVRIRGGGTKSSLLPPAAACLSTENLSGIYAYARDDLYVTVGAGTRLAELQKELAQDRMWVPLVSPWAEATVGGIVASNFNVPLRMRYGSLRDLVLAATVVLPDGRLIRAGRPLVKNVAGYDLVKLFVGSFGTLGLMADVTLKLTPLPRARSTVIVPLDDSRLGDPRGKGLVLGARLLRVCLTASALLLCNDCNVPGVSAPYALIYTAEGLVEDVAAELAQVQRVLEAEGTSAVSLAGDAPSGSELWSRWLRAAAPTETVVRIGATLRDLPALLHDNFSFIADLASGLLYARGDAQGIETLRRAARAAGEYVVMLSAPTAPEDRSAVWDHKPDALDVMRALKTRWDPRGLCNPDAFLI